MAIGEEVILRFDIEHSQGVSTCPICGYYANVFGHAFDDKVVWCARCGDFVITDALCDDWPSEHKGDKKFIALASYVIRSLQHPERPPHFDRKGLLSLLDGRTLPTPAEAAESLILWLGDVLNGNPGDYCAESYTTLAGLVGGTANNDVMWLKNSLISSGLIEAASGASQNFEARLTFAGWNEYEKLRIKKSESHFSFFARQFDNVDLDQLYETCLRPAVRDTGFDLRTVSQKAGHIDSIVEYEIRTCKFLIADLSDNNAGAYWEAGLAEGLGKPVIYICRKGVVTHFDTEHRQTIRWDLTDSKMTADKLKAIIRNTLLGQAKQIDE